MQFLEIFGNGVWESGATEYEPKNIKRMNDPSKRIVVL